jgi:hypothetical protein
VLQDNEGDASAVSAECAKPTQNICGYSLLALLQRIPDKECRSSHVPAEHSSGTSKPHSPQARAKAFTQGASNSGNICNSDVGGSDNCASPRNTTAALVLSKAHLYREKDLLSFSTLSIPFTFDTSLQTKAYAAKCLHLLVQDHNVMQTLAHLRAPHRLCNVILQTMAMGSQAGMLQHQSAMLSIPCTLLVERIPPSWLLCLLSITLEVKLTIFAPSCLLLPLWPSLCGPGSLIIRQRVFSPYTHSQSTVPDPSAKPANMHSTRMAGSRSRPHISILSSLNAYAPSSTHA